MLASACSSVFRFYYLRLQIWEETQLCQSCAGKVIVFWVYNLKWRYINLFIPGIWLPWSATKGQYITSGRRLNISRASNLQSCMTRCFRDSTGAEECRAITISTSLTIICELRAHRVGDKASDTESSPAWQSFSRPVWYLGRGF